MMNERTDQQRLFSRNGKALRPSKKSDLYYSTDYGGDENEDIEQKFHHRSVSMTALHMTGGSPQSLDSKPAQMESLETKMASIEVSLPATPRRKKGSSVSGGLTSSGNRNREHYRELDSLRVALRDKENIIQTLKGQLCNTLSNRLAMRNGAPPLTEADKKASEERLHRLKRDADNKRLAIKNLKLALDRLDITDNIDVRIQQAELEYRLGREELELLTLKEETRTLQTAIELAESQDKQKSDSVYSCITGSAQITIHAVEVGADPKSPRFGAGPREDAAGLYVDWAVEDSGLCKGDRILEVNGKLVVSAGRNDLTRLLAVAPDAAQIVVLRRNDSLAMLRNLRSDNLRLTHRISYLEEQVRDLLAPTTEAPVQSGVDSTDGSARRPQKERPQIFQKGPQVTALVSGLPGLNLGSPDSRQGLSNSKVAEALSAPRNRTSSRHKHQQQQQLLQPAKSSASLDLVQPQPRYDSSMLSSPRRRTPKNDEHHHHHRTRRQLLSSLEFDSDTAYHRLQQQVSGDHQTNSSTETSSTTSHHQNRHEIAISSRSRPAPPKKPLRLSLHRATSLQSVESAPAAPISSGCSSPSGRKPTKRNHRGDPEPPSSAASLCSVVVGSAGRNSPSSLGSSIQHQQQEQQRAPSRAESCQSALRWPSPKSCTARARLAHVSVEKWC